MRATSVGSRPSRMTCSSGEGAPRDLQARRAIRRPIWVAHRGSCVVEQEWLDREHSDGPLLQSSVSRSAGCCSSAPALDKPPPARNPRQHIEHLHQYRHGRLRAVRRGTAREQARSGPLPTSSMYPQISVAGRRAEFVCSLSYRSRVGRRLPSAVR